ncbi:hypothetical protein DIPPA_22206 [Diplonema papillatum]|nr:hypothetical protein DIPPA_22206 [Diplonema papillatum]
MSATRESVGSVFSPLGADAKVFRHYCPLCMVYFKDVLSTTCCKNNICTFCAADLAPAEGVPDALKECPYCMRASATLLAVQSGALGRSYKDSPRSPRFGGASAFASPLTTGATFEEMVAKLTPLPKIASAGNQPPAPPAAAAAAAPPAPKPPLPPGRAARRPQPLQAAAPPDSDSETGSPIACSCWRANRRPPLLNGSVKQTEPAWVASRPPRGIKQPEQGCYIM